MNLLLVGIGGTFGGICRYQLGKLIAQKSPGAALPIGTFIINISGAILLGLLTSMDAGNNGYLLWGEGFLGSYTTFSTFMYEGFNLFYENEKLNAFVYILGTFLLGILGYICGYAIGKLLLTA